jgi:hypothetical protein
VGDGPELFQDEKRRDTESNDQVALILSNHSYEHRKATHVKAPGLDDSKETDHKHGEFDLLGFVKLAANDSTKSEFHTTEEKLIVEYQRPERVRVVPAPSAESNDDRRDVAPSLPQSSAQQSTEKESLPATTDRRAVAAQQDQDQDRDEATAVVVGYKKHTVDHVAKHKHPELLGGIFNIDTDSFKDQESALVRRGNEERYAEKTTKHEGGSVNVGPIPLVYIGDKGVTNYYESKRTKLDPNDYVKTNMGFLPIEE